MGTRSPDLVVAVLTRAAADVCREAGADRVVLACGSKPRVGAPFGAHLPRLVHDSQMPRVLECAGASADAAVAGNLGVVRRLGAEGRTVEADWGMNVVNPWAVEALAGLGATAVWASTELSGRQIASLVAGSRVPVGVVVGGRLELMVAEHCVLQAAGPCDHVCAGCTRR